MEAIDACDFLTVRKIAGVVIVRFATPSILGCNVVECIGDYLESLTGRGVHLVFSFRGVQILSSVMLGKLVEINKKVLRLGGRVDLCGVEAGGHLQRVLETTRLTKLFTIYPTEWDALRAADRAAAPPADPTSARAAHPAVAAARAVAAR